MLRQTQEIDAEGGHQGGMVSGQIARINVQVQVGGGQMLRVVVGGGCGRPVGVFDQRPLQLVGNHSQFIMSHVQQRIDAGLNSHGVGSGDELTVSDQLQLVSPRDDPLSVGGGQVPAQPQHLCSSAEWCHSVGGRCPRGLAPRDARPL